MSLFDNQKAVAQEQGNGFLKLSLYHHKIVIMAFLKKVFNVSHQEVLIPVPLFPFHPFPCRVVRATDTCGSHER